MQGFEYGRLRFTSRKLQFGAKIFEDTFHPPHETELSTEKILQAMEETESSLPIKELDERLIKLSACLQGIGHDQNR